MKRLSVAVLLATALSAIPAIAGNGTPVNNSANTLTIAVYGDAPYGTTPTDNSETNATPAFIQAIDDDPKVRLVIHVGDIHSGKQYCTEAYDRQIYALWAAFKNPLIYTPGDNEWTDCHKTAEGGGAWNNVTHQIDYVLDPATSQPVDYAKGDPIANLELVRSIFFADPGFSLGGQKKQMLSQSQYFDALNHPRDGDFVENVIWVQSRIVFVTINLPGGSNNDNDIWYGAPSMSLAQSDEILQRTGADLRWLDQAFALAADNDVVGVVIIAQADMWDTEKGKAHQSQYEPFVQSIANHSLALNKPVLMFNGDSHVYRSDNPLAASDPLNFMHPGYDVPNFHRIVVHGSTFPLEYLRFTIDPRADAAQGANAFGPFSWERVMP